MLSTPGQGMPAPSAWAWHPACFVGRILKQSSSGRFIILDEDGKLGLTTATPEAFNIQSQADVLKKVSWTVPTLVGTKLFLRDLTSIIALDLG